MFMTKFLNCCHSTVGEKLWNLLQQLCCMLSLRSYQLTGVQVCVIPQGLVILLHRTRQLTRDLQGERGVICTDQLLIFTFFGGQTSGKMVKICFVLCFHQKREDRTTLVQLPRCSKCHIQSPVLCKWIQEFSSNAYVHFLNKKNFCKFS